MTDNNKSPFGKDPLKPYAYAFAGLAMMLNIRLVYSAAPYALLRFKLPENLFSVFVRVMAGSLELWCLPGFVVINIMDFARKPTGKQWHDWYYHWQSIVVQWLNFVTFVILWISFIIGGDQGNVTAFYWVIAASGFVFGINNPLIYAIEFQYLSWYMVGENSFPVVTSLMHYVGTLFFGNRRKWNSDYIIVTIDIIISLAISLVAAVLWTLAYYEGKPDGYPPDDSNQRSCKSLNIQPGISGTDPILTYSIVPNFGPDNHATTGTNECGLQKSPGYWAYFIPPTLMVIVGMGLVYAIYPAIAPGMIVPFYLVDKIEMVLLIATTVPPIIIAILKQYDYNPYVNKGNWGYEHQKSCKSTSQDGAAPDSKTGNCQDCGSCTATSLTLKDELNPSAGGAVTLNNGDSGDSFKSNATVTITSEDVDFTALSEVNITITQGTIKKSDGGNLQTSSSPNNGDVLSLNAKGKITEPNNVKDKEVTLKGTIKVTSTGKEIGTALTISGGPGGLTGILNLESGNVDGKQHVNITGGTLKIDSNALTALKDASGTLKIGKDGDETSVKYKLINSNTIILGLSTFSNITSGANNANVTLKGLPTSPITMAPNGTSTDGISATLTDVTFTKDDAKFGNLKTSGGAGLTLNLDQSFTAKITKPAGGAPQPLKKDTQLDPDTELNIEGSFSGTTINANILITKGGKLSSGSTNYTLKGGITGNLSGLSDAGDGTGVTGTLRITNVSYDPYEFHDKHKDTLCCFYGKVFKWTPNPLYQWHIFTILVPLKICLAAIFIYSLHYRDSSIAISIVNQPKMSTSLSIMFYMCHEILLAMGFPGVASDDYVLLPMQLIGAYLMVLLAYYSVGYITEYKKHDPSHWPTEGMTKWNALCYWLKMASKITNKNFKQLFTTDLRRDLLLCIQKNELI